MSSYGLYVFILLGLIPLCWSTATIEIALVSFTNYAGTDANGNECDKIINQRCDHIFTFCLSIVRMTNFDVENCDILGPTKSKEYPNSRTVDFGSNYGGEQNPLKGTVIEWRGFAELKIKVEDEDTTFDQSDDLVDHFRFPIESLSGVIPAKNKSVAELKEVIILGVLKKMPSNDLTLKYRVYCDIFYFGPDCATYCRENASDTTFTCDKDTGRKICKQEPNPCESSPCPTGAACLDRGSSYECVCIDKKDEKCLNATLYGYKDASSSSSGLSMYIIIIIVASSVLLLMVIIVITIVAKRRNRRAHLRHLNARFTKDGPDSHASLDSLHACSAQAAFDKGMDMDDGYMSPVDPHLLKAKSYSKPKKQDANYHTEENPYSMIEELGTTVIGPPLPKPRNEGSVMFANSLYYVDGKKK